MLSLVGVLGLRLEGGGLDERISLSLSISLSLARSLSLSTPVSSLARRRSSFLSPLHPPALKAVALAPPSRSVLSSVRVPPRQLSEATDERLLTGRARRPLPGKSLRNFAGWLCRGGRTSALLRVVHAPPILRAQRALRVRNSPLIPGGTASGPRYPSAPMLLDSAVGPVSNHTMNRTICPWPPDARGIFRKNPLAQRLISPMLESG
jgi:hypothetical protein